MARSKSPKDEVSTASATAKVLGKNLTTLMEIHPELDSNPKMAEKTGLGTGTISRLRNGMVDTTLASLELIAKAFDLEPWQLLVPNLDPANKPVLQPLSEQERKLYARLAEAVKEIQSGT